MTPYQSKIKIMTPYQKLHDIVYLANKPNVALNGSVDINVEFLNSVSVMVEELRDCLELIQRLKGPGVQVGITSYLATRAIDQADFISHKYWPEE